MQNTPFSLPTQCVNLQNGKSNVANRWYINVTCITSEKCNLYFKTEKLSKMKLYFKWRGRLKSVVNVTTHIWNFKSSLWELSTSFSAFDDRQTISIFLMYCDWYEAKGAITTIIFFSSIYIILYVCTEILLPLKNYEMNSPSVTW